MATLTTLNGAVITFNPSTVCAIADHSATGEAATCVYGVGPAKLMTAENIHDFMRRIKISASFAKLTLLDGNPVWIRGSAVSMLRASSRDESPGAKTVIVVGSLTQAVKESPAQATAALNAYGGNL